MKQSAETPGTERHSRIAHIAGCAVASDDHGSKAAAAAGFKRYKDNDRHSKIGRLGGVLASLAVDLHPQT